MIKDNDKRATGTDTDNKENEDWLKAQRINLTPSSGFSLVGTDRLADIRGELYTIKVFDTYKGALDAKKSRDNSEEYHILYKDAEGNCCYR